MSAGYAMALHANTNHVVYNGLCNVIAGKGCRRQHAAERTIHRTFYAESRRYARHGASVHCYAALYRQAATNRK